MTIPTSPYCTTADLALSVPVLLKGASDFSVATTPNNTAALKYINWAATSINRAFMDVGYIIPFEEDIENGISWNDEQNSYLELLNVIGAAEYVTRSIKPNPAALGRNESLQNLFRLDFESELERIRTGQVRFSAKAIAGSIADILNQKGSAYYTTESDLYSDFISFIDWTADKDIVLSQYSPTFLDTVARYIITPKS